MTELLSRANQYNAEAKNSAKEQSSIAQLAAEERRSALANDLMSRRQFMDKTAIEEAEEEMKKQAPYIERMIATRKALQEHYYKDSSIESIPSEIPHFVYYSTTNFQCPGRS